ncbi:MAG: sugar phosphate isomerase/epimerase [Chloroflexi bacterium]|nr:sugar phosphate isomerase/epimerase [Chloroflexota bacterium]
MHKAICIGSLPGATDEERFASAARYGFQGIEVNTLRDVAARQATRQLSERYGIPVVSVMNSDHWQYPLSDPDPAVVERSLAGIAQSIDTAVALGADTVLVVPAVVKPDVTYEQAWSRSLAAMRRVLPLAERHGVVLAIENVWNKFLLSPIEFAAYIDSLQSPWARAYFDVGNILLYGYPQHWIGTLSSRIARVHIKGFDVKRMAFTYLMEGSADWAAVLTALREVGYDRTLTAELPVDTGNPLGRLREISMDMDKILAL